MFAVGNTTPITPTPTLVATALPNAIALRAPYDNVAPSVSSAQLDNNASGNRIALPKGKSAQLVELATTTTENFSPAISNSSATFTANARTAFLAQLAGGNISAETHGIFAQYEKLVNYANVKYKPSNAGKPSEPVRLFKTLLQQEQTDSSELLVTDVITETLPAPEPKRIKKIILPAPQPAIKLEAYSATAARNLDIIQKDLESA